MNDTLILSPSMRVDQPTPEERGLTSVIDAALDIVSSWVRGAPLSGVDVLVRAECARFHVSKLFLVQSLLPERTEYVSLVWVGGQALTLCMIRHVPYRMFRRRSAVWTAELWQGETRLSCCADPYPLTAARNAALALLG